MGPFMTKAPSQLSASNRLRKFLTVLSLLAATRAASCVVSAPTWTKSQAFVTQGSQSSLQVTDSSNAFTKTGADCSVVLFNVFAEYENGTKASAGFATIADASAPLTNISVLIKPSSTQEASTNMAVYVQAVDLATKATGTFCFMYRASGSTVDFCCPPNFDKTGCLSCAASQFVPQNTAFSQDIWSLSKGCAKCDATKGFNPYLYTGANGDVYRGCQYISPNTPLKENDQCSFGSVMVKTTTTSGVSTLTCTACTSIIDDCPLCASKNTCLKCSQTRQKVTLKDPSQQSYDLCTSNWCYGCAACTVQNCASCDWQTPTVCKQCQPRYYLDATGTSCQEKQNQLELNLFVHQYSQVQMNNIDLSRAQSANGNSMSSAFYFIQQALYEVYLKRQVERYLSVKANIWLGRGDHFFIQCHSYNKNYGQATDVTKYCVDLPNLSAVYPTTDNVDFYFRPLFCEYLDDTTYQVFQGLNAATKQLYLNECIPQNTLVQTPANSGPRVHIPDNHSYFNVTRSMSFDSIEFRGENALAYLTGTPGSTFPLNTIPVKLCQVLDSDEAKITGKYEKVILTTNAGQLPTRTFSCDDQSFENISIPMKDFEPCKLNSDGTGYGATINVNRMQPKCKFEPYRQEFFTKDPSSGIYYYRQQVLFNLYGFSSDQQSAYALNKVPQLKLSNCKFKFFLKDYDSLINIETDNFVQITQPSMDKPILARMGQDKGGRVHLYKSTFSHSRFCKGLISYKKSPTLQGSLLKNFYFVADAQGTQTTSFVSGSEPLILLEGSTFTNLNLGKSTQYLSVENLGLQTLYGYPQISYQPFDNLGIVLNLQGFPGGLEIFKSTMSKNMVYIPDIFPSTRKESFDFESNTVKAAINELQQYKSDNLFQFSLKRCDQFRVRRLFSDFLSSFKDHPDQLLLQMERQSLIYISKPERPVIIRNSTFADNLGIFGGAIFIDSPNMQANDAYKSDAPNANTRPIVLINQNYFWRNSAYSSGNAIYLRGTRVRDTEAREYQQSCGGFYITSNEFQNNTAVTKSHNGGAITVACDYVDPADTRYLGATSNVDTATANRTMQISYYLTNEQQTVYRVATGIVNNTFTNNTSSQKGLAIYSRHMQYLFIKDNVFTYNQPHFTYSEDTYASVYYTYLAKQARYASFYDERQRPHNTCRPSKLKLIQPNNLYCQADDELAFFEYHATTADGGEGLIDWPQVQGTVHVEGCNTCLVSYFVDDQNCKFCQLLPQYFELRNNIFDRNQGGFSLYEEANLPRASQVFISGGMNETVISQNVFNNITQHIGREYFDMIQTNLTSYYRAMFPGYWDKQQSPLIHVEVPESINFRINNTFANSSAYDQSLSTVYFEDNQVTSVVGVQPFIEQNRYRGSLINFESKSLYATLRVQRNYIEDCYVIGQDAALFYMSGGSLHAFNNSFERIGSLTNQTFTQPKTNFAKLTPVLPILDYTEPMQYAPYFGYPYQPNVTISLTMDRGIFWLETGPMNRTNVSLPVNNTFFGNSFNYVFCHQGCIYTLDITRNSHPTHNLHKSNYYRNIYGIKGAIQLTTVQDQQTRMDFTQGLNVTYSVQEYQNETLINVQNGAYVTKADQHEVLQIFRDIWFQNVFGQNKSAAISLENGAALYCSNCTFMQTLDPYERLNYTRKEYNQMLSQMVLFKFNRIYFDAFISNSTLRQYFGNGPTNTAQIELRNVTQKHLMVKPSNVTLEEIDPDLWTYVWMINWCKQNATDYMCKQIPKYDGSLRKLLLDEFEVDGNQTYSIVSDSNFIGLQSNLSAFFAENSDVHLNRTNFRYNRGSQGTRSSTILAIKSNVTLEQVICAGNMADVGACIQATDYSNITALTSVFYQNTAYKSGGTLFAEGETLVTIFNSAFRENDSLQEGGIIALENTSTQLAQITQSNFTQNQGKHNTLSLRYAQLVVGNCEFSDNFAQVTTHGAYLYNSQMRFSNVRVSQSATRDPDLDSKIQSGFFYLTANSYLEVLDRSVFQHTFGQKASVAYIDADSFMFAQNSYFLDILSLNAALLDGTGVIVGSHGRGLTIDSCTFQNCDNTHIAAEDTQVSITKTAFKLGRRSSYINVRYSQLVVANNVFIAASDGQAKGKAISCTGCYSVNIAQNQFSKLRGMRGGAIYLEDSSSSSIVGNLFTDNSAEQGGAIYIFYSDVQITNNNFTNNEALNNGHIERNPGTQHSGSGGAVFFTCVNLQDSNSYYRDSPEYDYFGNYVNTTLYNNNKPTCQVDLANNVFVKNKGEAKGGALMYTNVNFTESAPNKFANNTSASGGDFSSPPARIEISLPGADEQFRRNLLSGFEVVSGREIKLAISLINAQGQVAGDDNSSVAEIVFEETPSFGFLKGNQVIAQNGVFNFENLYIKMQPGESAKLKLNILNLDTYGNLLYFIEEPIQIGITARACDIGEMLTAERICKPCPPGFYSIERNITEPSVCHPCPDHAICLGGSDMTPQQGFVRVDETSVIFIRCLNDRACMLPEKTDKLGKCDKQKGYKGYMCSECMQGFWRRDNIYECYKCSNSNVARFLWILSIAAFLLVIVGIITVFKRNFQGQRQMTVPIIRMVITYFQLYSILSGLEMFSGSKQTNFFLQLINIRSLLMAPAELFLDLQCLQLKSIDDVKKYYLLMGFQALLPLIIIAVAFIVHTLFSQLSRCCSLFRQKGSRSQVFTGTSFEVIKLRVYVTTCIVLYIVYPKMIEQLLGSLHCFKALADGPGDVIIHRLRNHPEILCSDKNYKWFRGFIFIPGVIVWVVIFPIFIIKKFFDKKNEIYDSQTMDYFSEDKDIKKLQDSQLVKAQFGFLYAGLKIDAAKKTNQEEEKQFNETQGVNSVAPSYMKQCWNFFAYIPLIFRAMLRIAQGQGLEFNTRSTQKVVSYFYWEIVVFFGKLGLIVIQVYFTDINENIQMNLTLTIIAILLFIQLKNYPYEREVLNNMHVTLLTSILIVTYTRTAIKDFNISYSEWRQRKIILGFNPTSQELGMIARLYEFETNGLSFFYNAIIVLVIVFTFSIDLYFVYHLYIQALLYIYKRNKNSKLYQWLTLKNQRLQKKVDSMWKKEQAYQTEEKQMEKHTEPDEPDERYDSSEKARTPSISLGQSEESVRISSSSERSDSKQDMQDIYNNAPRLLKTNQDTIQTHNVYTDPRETARSRIMSPEKDEFNKSEERQAEDSVDADLDQDVNPSHFMRNVSHKMFHYEPASTERSNQPILRRMQTDGDLDEEATPKPKSRFMQGNLDQDRDSFREPSPMRQTALYRPNLIRNTEDNGDSGIISEVQENQEQTQSNKFAGRNNRVSDSFDSDPLSKSSSSQVSNSKPQQNISNAKNKPHAKQDARKPRFELAEDDSPKDRNREEDDISQRGSNADLLGREVPRRGIFNKRREISASASRSPQDEKRAQLKQTAASLFRKQA